MKCLRYALLAVLTSSSSLAFAQAAPMPAAPPAAPPAAANAGPPAIVTDWDRHHPDAARALGDWVHQHPAGARRVFKWDRRHPLRTKALVAWAADHPGQRFEDFAASHADWPVLDRFMRAHQDAMDGLIVWIQANSGAARELVQVPRGLAWVGFHVYRPLWAPAGEEAPGADAVPEDK